MPCLEHVGPFPLYRLLFCGWVVFKHQLSSPMMICSSSVGSASKLFKKCLSQNTVPFVLRSHNLWHRLWGNLVHFQLGMLNCANASTVLSRAAISLSNCWQYLSTSCFTCSMLAALCADHDQPPWTLSLVLSLPA